MSKTINILGHKVKVCFCMSVEIEYEELSGQPFDLELISTQKASMQLCYAAMKVANDKMPFTLERLNREASLHEIAQLKDAVLQEMNEWLGIPKVMEDKAQSDEGDPKNA